MTQLKFDALFRAALKDWPEALDLTVIETADTELSRYSIRGLGRQAEDIERRYFGKKDEVIRRELHWALYTVIHAAARNITSLRVTAIRAETVRSTFERRLRTAADAKDGEWEAADFALVNRYFEENAR
ncbi:MAG TPA: hypothetical protein VHA82_00820 [Ramlibacter sp.]|uniref:hypothetical protein n=1 Tax=Ramlibacter sp. TaxID=1917967 RepID=UPI002B7DFFC2|nr:hypothetical protein [Ramlibacter sp.]HVZ42322.1 hypothetical protein [Ramlibacter sp.]